MALLEIESALVRVGVDPDFGARVVSLVDRRSGRDWMAKGSGAAETGEDAVYGAEAAIGWDECFPTVAPWDAQGTAHRRRLRDHGDLWGRPFSVDFHDVHSLALSRTAGGFHFARILRIDGEVLHVDYAVTNAGAEALPYMWALHGLLAVDPQDRIELDASTVTATYLARQDRIIHAPRLAWPGPNRELNLQFDRVYPATERFAGKFYASGLARAAVRGPNGDIELAWDPAQVGHLGIWLNYGRWPEAGNVHHIALEPTTAPVDHLGQALEHDTAVMLAPGATERWTITLTLIAPHGSDHE